VILAGWHEAARHGSARPSPDDPVALHATTHGRTRPGRPDEVHITALHLDPFAQLTLALMRLHFQTFSAPETQGWLMALRLVTTHVGPGKAATLCYDLVALVQSLRSARTSPFAFNPETCASCRFWLTPEERRLMEMLEALRHGQAGRTRAVVQMLCDGARSDDLIAMAEIYLLRHAQELPDPARPAPTKTLGD
jgi:hypothetical protein